MRRHRSLTYVAAALLVVAAVWAVAYWAVIAERDRALAESAAQASRLAVFFERQTLAILRYGDAYVKMVRREYRNGHDIEAIQRLLRAIPYDRSLVSHITIIDETGSPRLVSGFPIRPGTSAADRDYFRFHQAGGSDRIFISLPHVGRNSEKLIFRLVRRIDGPSGEFAGVIFAALDAETITGFFAAMNLGPQSSATLVGNDKRVRARSSYGREGPGQDISGSRIWRELERSPVGLYRQTSVVDGVTRYYAYRQLAEFPLIVAIGVSTDDIAQTVKQFQLPAYLIASLATIVILSLTFLLSREAMNSRRIAASEARVRGMRDELERRFAERSAELESVQQELLRKERLAVLGQLTGTVAHELRNPLGTIATSVAVVERRARDAGLDVTKALARTQRGVERCNNIITELLDFARARGLDRQPTRVDDWLSEVLDELSVPREITLVRELGAGTTEVAFDRDRLRRVVINLVDNARDAVLARVDEGAREIRVATRIADGRAWIEVADNGPGIPADLLAKIHEPLFSTKTFGVGLGLPIVRQAMEEHGGVFEIAGDAGRGTRAVLWLPLAEAGAR